MAKISRLNDGDWVGLTVVAVIGVGAWLFRHQTIEPFWTVGACAAAHPPAFCVPRQAVLWLQYRQVFGWVALLLGLSGFVLGRKVLGILAVAFAIAAVVNFNATTGIIGGALGLFGWMGVNTGRYSKTAS